MAQAIDSLNNLTREAMPQKQHKSSIGTRILSSLLKTKTTRQHEAYQRHVKKAKAAGKKPYSFKYWSREPVYFRGVQAVERNTKKSK